MITMVTDFEELKKGYPHAYAEFIKDIEKQFKSKESDIRERIEENAARAAGKETYEKFMRAKDEARKLKVAAKKAAEKAELDAKKDN